MYGCGCQVCVCVCALLIKEPCAELINTGRSTGTPYHLFKHKECEVDFVSLEPQCRIYCYPLLCKKHVFLLDVMFDMMCCSWLKKDGIRTGNMN